MWSLEASGYCAAGCATIFSQQLTGQTHEQGEDCARHLTYYLSSRCGCES
jgi:hypothetical protein